MPSNYDIGHAAAQQGYKTPPKADHYIPQQQRDAGFNHFRNAPPPLAPRPVTTSTPKKY